MIEKLKALADGLAALADAVDEAWERLDDAIVESPDSAKMEAFFRDIDAGLSASPPGMSEQVAALGREMDAQTREAMLTSMRKRDLRLLPSMTVQSVLAFRGGGVTLFERFSKAIEDSNRIEVWLQMGNNATVATALREKLTSLRNLVINIERRPLPEILDTDPEERRRDFEPVFWAADDAAGYVEAVIEIMQGPLAEPPVVPVGADVEAILANASARDILVAMLELGATQRLNCRSAQEITDKAIGPGKQHKNYPFAELKAAGLIDAQRGGQGGRYLTALGITHAAAIQNSK